MSTLKRVRSLPPRGARYVVITERAASATRDRPTDSDRRRARIAGIFFVITFISIPALPLYDQVLNHTHFIVGGGGDLRVELGGAVRDHHPHRRHRHSGGALPRPQAPERRPRARLCDVRVVESALIAVGIVSLLAVVTRRFAQFGIVAGSLALVTAILVLFGAYKQISGPSTILTAPEAIWELSPGIYLITKGFRPDASSLRRSYAGAHPDQPAELRWPIN
jgi:hypothetical protein